MEHFAALCVPHFIVEVAGIGQELCVGTTFCHFTLQNKGRKSGIHIPTFLGTGQPMEHIPQRGLEQLLMRRSLKQQGRTDCTVHSLWALPLKTRSCALLRLQEPLSIWTKSKAHQHGKFNCLNLRRYLK